MHKGISGRLRAGLVRLLAASRLRGFRPSPAARGQGFAARPARTLRFRRPVATPLLRVGQRLISAAVQCVPDVMSGVALSRRIRARHGTAPACCWASRGTPVRPVRRAALRRDAPPRHAGAENESERLIKPEQLCDRRARRLIQPQRAGWAGQGATPPQPVGHAPLLEGRGGGGH